METITTTTVEAVEALRRRDGMKAGLEFTCVQANVLSGAYNVQVTPFSVVVQGYAGTLDKAFTKFGIDKTATPDREHTTNAHTYRCWSTTFDGVEVEFVEDCVAKDVEAAEVSA